MPTLSQPKTYLKAIYSGLVAFVGTLAASISEASTFADISLQTWLIVVGATLAGFGSVYFATNAEPV